MNDDVAKIAAEDGFQILDTGGGCKAFYRVMLDDSILLLTTDDGSDIPETLDDQCLLGHYTDEDLCEEATPIERGTAKECFQIAFRKPRPHDCWDHPSPYEHYTDGQRFHGTECAICGELLCAS